LGGDAAVSVKQGLLCAIKYPIEKTPYRIFWQRKLPSVSLSLFRSPVVHTAIISGVVEEGRVGRSIVGIQKGADLKEKGRKEQERKNAPVLISDAWSFQNRGKGKKKREGEKPRRIPFPR